MYRKFLVIVLLATSILSYGQKRPLNVYDLAAFQVIKQSQISRSGKWISFYSEPYRGDPWLFVISADKKANKKFVRGKSPKISPGENYIAFRVLPGYDTIRALKLKGVSKKKFPKDSLYVYVTQSGTVLKYPKLKSLIVPQEEGNVLGFLQYLPDSISKKQKDQALKTYKLNILLPPGTNLTTFENISEATVSGNGQTVAFCRYIEDSTAQTSTIFAYFPATNRTDSLYSINGIIKKLTLSNDGKHLAFIQTTDTSGTKVYSLLLLDISGKSVKTIVDTNTSSIPNKWTVSEHSEITFSGDGTKLFFGIAPKPEPPAKDTIPEDEKPVVDIWSWTDSILMTQQLADKEDDEKLSYTTVYHLTSGKIVRLQQNKYQRIRFYQKRNADKALLIDPTPYLKQRSWDYPWWNDYYVIDLKTGKKTLAARKTSIAYMSPSGKYVVWYNFRDSSWYSQNLETNTGYKLTDNLNVKFYDEENDIPAPAGPYGFAGFSPDEKFVYLYDRYDVWAFDPSGQSVGFCLTAGYGRKNNIQLRLLDLNTDDDYLNPEATIVKAFNKTTKDAGFFKLNSFTDKNTPKQLILTPHYYYRVTKAKNANKIIFQRSAVDEYPDIWYSDLNFKRPTRLSNLVNQQKPFIWATVELVKWTTTEGKTEEGLLFKPANFDPSKKYPMIVYYYELYSDQLHRYFYPVPSRSIINPIHYASNGYIVFIPNIRYKTGYPGMSAYNYVISGTLSLVEKYPWIDKAHIGLQGQSWGGYETAYIITQTGMFAAAMAGAPVSNMTSAYGGIRWKTGLSRMFQYEKTQSRIGGTLWDKLPLYIYNSPVFYAPKITTPLLIMHNDNDGAVPWYQGIELFVALRRLNKPVWLLNYNGQPHNLKAKSPDCMDLTIRMMQFFDHYLKEKPMPYWMKYGIPATEKGKKLGYELTE